MTRVGEPGGRGVVVSTTLALACLLAARLALGAAGGVAAQLGLALDAALAVAAFLRARAAGRGVADHRSRRAWWFQIAFPLAWLVAPAAWLAGLPPLVADAGRLAAVGLVACSWWFAARAGGTWSRVRLVIDGGIGVACAVVVGWHWLLAPAVARAGDGPEGVAAVAVPVATVGVIVLGAGMVLTEMRGRHRGRPLAYLAGLTVLMASDVAFALGLPTAWGVGWALYWWANRHYVGPSPRVRLVTTRGRLVYLPYTLILPATAVFAVDARAGDLAPPEVVGAAAVVLLLVARQHVTLIENDELVARLEATERILRHQATHDPLTGLPGRVLLLERLATLAAERTRGGGGPPVALAFLDLDSFKGVNDEHGHAAGDAVLVEVGRRLTATLPGLREQAIAARLSGDEFAVLAVGDAALDPAAVRRTVIDAVERPVVVEGAPLPVAASVGVATSWDGVLDPSRLLRAADLAMYEVKRAAANAG